MAFVFNYTMMPAGVGGAIYQAQSAKANFARRVELARLQLERQRLELDQARMAQTGSELEWRRRAEAAQQAEQVRQFDVRTLLERQQQAGVDRRFEVEAGLAQQRVGLEQEQQAGVERRFQAEMGLAREKFDYEQRQVKAQELNFLSKSGALPMVPEKFDPQTMTEYRDASGRQWMLPQERVDAKQVAGWVAFARNKLGRLNSEFVAASTRRRELLESQAEAEKRVAAVEQRLQRSGKAKELRARYETELKRAQEEVRRAVAELQGVRPADEVRQDIERWEEQYQRWIGLLPPEDVRAMLSAETPAVQPVNELPPDEDPEEYIRSFLSGRRR